MSGWDGLEVAIITGRAQRILATVLIAIGILVTAALLTSCGPPSRPVRIGVEQTSEAINSADRVLEQRNARRGEEVRARLSAERRSGDLVAETEAELEAASLRRFNTLMAPETLAVETLEAAKHGTLSVEAVLDGWDAGVRDEGDLMGAAACAVAALVEVAHALTAAGLELPDSLTSAITWLSGFARGGCPVPDDAELASGGAS